LEPITVIFTIPEDSLGQVEARLRKKAKLTVDAFDRTAQKKDCKREAVDARQPDRHHHGTVKGRALFDNKNDALFPNQFVNTRLLVNTLQGVTLIPSSAIQQNGQASFVYVIQNNVAHMRSVKPGVTNGGVTQVTASIPETLSPTAASISCRTTPRSPFRTSLPPAHHERERRAVSPSRPFILRPVATSLLMAAILLVGMVGYTQLPVSALPEVDYPTIQVLTFYPGASPNVMATTVTAPLERQFGELQGLSQMTSTSSGGTSVIVLQFNLTLSSM
jgi:hypothetical protein